MIMRFHWGMGIGHTGPVPASQAIPVVEQLSSDSAMDVDVDSLLIHGNRPSSGRLSTPSETDSDDSGYDRAADSEDDPLHANWTDDEEGEVREAAEEDKVPYL
jgi:hypothetical protein